MAIADLLTEVGLAGSVTTLSAPGKAIGTFNINIGSTANWPSAGKTVYFAMRTVNPSAITTSNLSGQVIGTYSEWKGIVGTNAITSMQLQTGSTDQLYIAGSNTQVFIPVTAPRENALVTWGQVHADNQGNLLTTAVQTALGAGSQALNGWNALAYPFNTVTNNGNRSYACVINGQDVTGTLSPGMRIRPQRTVAAPTQSTSLNGTTQYWSKTAPAGMTFTDNFTVSAWIKLNSYGANSVIMSRGSAGTNGWQLYLTAAGQIEIFGKLTSAYRGFTTYQSVSLNKWVHVAATLNMAGNVGTTYIDGVSVPNSVISGSSASSLTQAGNLEIGSVNGGAQFFPGKIAQAAVFSAVLSQATIQSYISQGLAGTETSLISAYSFNGNATDLNTTNANNLTANGSAVATNADSPFGGQGNGTISATLDYGIVQSVSFSTNTTVVVQVAEGCTIPTTGGVAAVSYSSNKAPYLFPAQKDKWIVYCFVKTDELVSFGATNIWYAANNRISVPIGNWDVGYMGSWYLSSSVAGIRQGYFTLQSFTPNNATRNYPRTSRAFGQGAAAATTNAYIKAAENISTSTTYNFYFQINAASGSETGTINGVESEFTIFAENAYL